MQSAVFKRSITFRNHKTSVSLEAEFWDGLKHIAHEREMTLSELVGEIDAGRTSTNLSSVIRQYVLGYFKALAEAQQSPMPIHGGVVHTIEAATP